jgi:hypothetical protein
LPSYYALNGDLTLLPQVRRYSGGAPDYGYYYPTVDYTVGTVDLLSGSITVEPGTVIAVCNEQISGEYYPYAGFELYDGTSFISHGTPALPITFTATKLVQESPSAYWTWVAWAGLYPPPSVIQTFVPESVPYDALPAPILDCRFCNFYLPIEDCHICSDGYPYGSPSVSLNLQDCAVHGGQIQLLSQYYYNSDYTYPLATATWQNTLFDHVMIDLEPTSYVSYFQGGSFEYIDVDFSFMANNNLFLEDWMEPLVIFPTPGASGGNWTFRDNLFDSVPFVQMSAEPLDYYNNAYWQLPASIVQWWNSESSFTFAGTLSATTTGDGTTDGSGDLTLTAPPQYQSGPFGNYYLPPTTQLHQAGSRTGDAAGLCQYTTRPDQTKEQIGQTIDIGLHYVAAGVNNMPMDTDGDGVPDYVEDSSGTGATGAAALALGETDYTAAMTDGMTPDALSTVYDDVDLSGDGLVGRIKKALGISPLDTSNPFTLTQVASGQQPGIASFAIPINYNLLSSVASLNLNLDGYDVALEDFTAASDGSTLLNWNTLYEPPGQHLLQAQITLNMAGDETVVVCGLGPLSTFYSGNVMQFFESDTMFDGTGAFLDAQLPEMNAAYKIDLYDPSTTPPTLLQEIANTTSTGMIQEQWDLTCSDGTTVFNGDTFSASFSVQLGSGRSGTAQKTQSRIATTEQGNNFDFVYFYTPSDSSMINNFSNPNGVVYIGMNGVVDTLLTPWVAGGDAFNNYDSAFDTYDNQYWPDYIGYPGYISTQATINSYLFPDLASGPTRNFYCYSHGSPTLLANFGSTVTMRTSDVNALLNNHWSRSDLKAMNPFRFVYLDACSTAATWGWRRAFGIFPLDFPGEERSKIGPQAFVGYSTVHSGWLNGNPKAPGLEQLEWAMAYTDTLNDFYWQWMSDDSLKACLDYACTQQWNDAPLPVPQNKNVQIAGFDWLLNQAYQYNNVAVFTSPLYVIGHSGLTRDGVKITDDLAPAYTKPASTGRN